MTEWIHTTKGRIVGERVAGDETWTHIRLAEEAWADVRHRDRDPIGATRTYRTSRLQQIDSEVARSTAEPTPREWNAYMDAESVRQVEKGYTAEHDDERGWRHLLMWAIDYARRGKAVESATLIRAAAQVINRASNGSGS